VQGFDPENVARNRDAVGTDPYLSAVVNRKNSSVEKAKARSPFLSPAERTGVPLRRACCVADRRDADVADADSGTQRQVCWISFDFTE
jgi:hypothetical protein